jgi:hypothetical protein
MKRQYRLTDEELQSIMDASKPVPYMVIGGVEPSSPQENANRAWQAVAAKHGFEWDTAEDAGTGDAHDLLAEPVKPVEPVCEAIDELNEKARSK